MANRISVGASIAPPAHFVAPVWILFHIEDDNCVQSHKLSHYIKLYDQ